MKLKHDYHRKAKNHLVMTWKEIVSDKEYDFSPAFFAPCIMLSFRQYGCRAFFVLIERSEEYEFEISLS